MSKNLELLIKYIMYLVNSSGEYISNLKLQKILYYCQAYYLAQTDKEIFSEDFEAWVHGPVIKEVYQKFKTNGSKPINIIDEFTIDDEEYDAMIEEIKERFTKEDINSDLIDEILEFYLPMSAFELERLSHQEEPWQKARAGYSMYDLCNEIISIKSIKEYYKRVLGNDIEEKT